MKTKIFEHAGYVGIEPGDKVISDPSQPGQLGTLIEVSEIEISPKAFDFLLNIPKSDSSLGDIMCFEDVFGFLGYGNHFVHPDTEGDRDYNPEILRKCITEVEAPAEFKEAVNVAIQVMNIGDE